MAKQRILYIQHAGLRGGSCMSLLYTMQSLDRDRFEPIVALIRPNSAVSSLYKDAGFQVIEWPGIRTLEHTTLAWWPLYSPLAWLQAGKTFVQWQQSQKRTLELVEFVRPDIVHLNSVVLVPSALALQSSHIPFVWHVREPAIQGHFGWRRRYISKKILSIGKEVIFICNADRESWVANQRGVVIYNFIDFNKFDYQINPKPIRDELEISANKKVILYLGGFEEVKGILPLLEALAIVGKQNQDILCIMPGVQCFSASPQNINFPDKIMQILVRDPLQRKINNKTKQLNVDRFIKLLPYQNDIAPFIAACDVLVFPSIRPHFARPVIEAAAMGKPAIASNLGGVRELIEHRKTGLLVEPNSPEALAKALLEVVSNEELAKTMGENAYLFAKQHFDATEQIQKIMAVYSQLD